MGSTYRGCFTLSGTAHYGRQVEANTGAGATILNTVGINYYNASGTTNYLANASTTVSVNLVRAALTISGRPTATSKGVTAAMPAGVTVASGTTQTYLIALTANANGGDTYALTNAISGVTNMASDSVTWATVKPDGATVENRIKPRRYSPWCIRYPGQHGDHHQYPWWINLGSGNYHWQH